MPCSPTARVLEGAQVAASAEIGDFVVVYAGAQVGEGCHVRGFTQLWPGVRLKDGVDLGPGVTLDAPAGDGGSDIVISEHCKIGAGALLGRGIRIGQGAEVTAGAVVAQNVPPFAIVSGSPARITGYTQSTSSEQSTAWHSHATFPVTPSVVRVGVGDVTMHRFKFLQDPRGDLSVGEFMRDIPFVPKRYFLVMNVPNDKTRGEHAHHRCHQFLVCVKGSCAVVVDDMKSRCEVQLDSADMGLYLPPLTWGIQYKYSADAVLMVFASHYYEADDYIRDYDDFLTAKRHVEQPA